MNATDALDLVQTALWTTILVSAPAVGAAMAVGIVVALFQALTQIQEATLTFIPKIFVMFLVLSLTAAFIGSAIGGFSDVIYGRIETGFQ
jgi:flagellar biosynthesis protein FliQ